MASTLFLMLKRLFSDLDTLQWMLFNNLFFRSIGLLYIFFFPFQALKIVLKISLFVSCFVKCIYQFLLNFPSQPSLHQKSTGQMSRARERE